MLEVIPLATARFTVGNMLDMGDTPHGRRIIGEVTQARLEGERLSANQVGSAADCALMRADGVVEIDVRISFETDDGALIFMQYDGYNDPAERGTKPILSMMRFETADERYAWLNRLQAVGKGEFTGEAVLYDIFELR